MRTAVITAIVLGFGTLAFVACGDNAPEAPNNSTGGDGGSGGTEQDAEPTEDANLGDVDPGMDATSNQKPYPAGPFGYGASTIIQNYKFLGWMNPTAVNYEGDLENIELADFYDPDGTKGIKALFINASAVWCSVCKLEQGHIRNQKAIYGPKGVVFLETLFEDKDQYPSTPADLAYWTKTYKLDWPTVLDPGNKLSPFFDTTATPMNMIIDTKTMMVKTVVTGLPDTSWWGTYLDPLTE